MPKSSMFPAVARRSTSFWARPRRFAVLEVLYYMGAVTAVLLAPVIIAPDGMVRALSKAGKPALDTQPIIMGLVLVAFGVLILFSKVTPWSYSATRGGSYEIAQNTMGITARIVALATTMAMGMMLLAVLFSKAAQFLTLTLYPLHGYRLLLSLLLLVFTWLVVRRPWASKSAWQIFTKVVFNWVFLLGFATFLFMVWWTIYRYSTKDQISKIVQDVTLKPLVDASSQANSVSIFITTLGCGALAYLGFCLPRPGLGYGQISVRIQGVVQIILAAVAIIALMALVVSVQLSPHWLIGQKNGFILFDIRLADTPTVWPLLAQLLHGVFLGNMPIFRVVSFLCVIFLVIGAAEAAKHFSYCLRIFGLDLAQTRMASPLWQDSLGKNFANSLMVGSALILIISQADGQQIMMPLAWLIFLSIFIEQLGFVFFLTNKHALEARGKKRQRLWRARFLNLVVLFLSGIFVVAIVLIGASGPLYVTLTIWLITVVFTWFIWRYYQITARLINMSESQTYEPKLGKSHAMVMVSKLHRSALLTIAWVQKIHGQNMEIVSLQTSEKDTNLLRKDWAQSAIDLPLTILDTSSKNYTKALCDYLSRFTKNPDDMVFVYFPHYRPTQRWTRLLFNRSFSNLRKKLLTLPQVVVCAVPFPLPISSKQIFTRYQDRLDNTQAWSRASVEESSSQDAKVKR